MQVKSFKIRQVLIGMTFLQMCFLYRNLSFEIEKEVKEEYEKDLDRDEQLPERIKNANN